MGHAVGMPFEAAAAATPPAVVVAAAAASVKKMFHVKHFFWPCRRMFVSLPP